MELLKKLIFQEGTFPPHPQKFSLKNFLYFSLKKPALIKVIFLKDFFCNLSFGARIKDFLIFFQKKAFLIFREMKLSSPKIKNFRRELSKLEK